MSPPPWPDPAARAELARATTHRARTRLGAWYLMGALAVGVLGLAAIALVGRSAPVAQKASSERTAAAAPSSSPKGAFDAQRFAQGAGVQPGDLPAGYLSAPPSPAQGLAVPVPVSTCPGVPVAHWLSDVVSPTYFSSRQLSGQVSAASETAVMADQADAQAALRATQDPSYPPRCVQAQSDTAAQQALGAINQQAPCHLTFEGSSVGPIPGESFGRTQTGYRYQATVGCQAEGSSETFVRDVVSTDVGRVFTQLTFSTTGGTVSQGLESRVVAAVNERAAGAPA